MDIFAHALWTYIFFHKKKWVKKAILFSELPDMLSWGLWFIWPFKNGYTWAHPDFSLLPQWLWTMYGITHSVFVISSVFVIVALLHGRLPKYMWAWPLAIMMDIPTHSRGFLPTPFLWPFSDWHFPGVSWSQWSFMVVNYSLIICGLLIIYRKKLLDLFRSFVRE